jgi:VanZ family protein
MKNAVRRFVTGKLGKRRWLPAVVWTIAILTVSSVPAPTLGPPLFPGCDKIAHFIEYSILGIALRFWAIERGGGGRRGTSGWVWERVRVRVAFLGGALVFAALDEVHQRLIPGRTMDFWDFTADACGLVVGFMVAGRLFSDPALEVQQEAGVVSRGQHRRER